MTQKETSAARGLTDLFCCNPRYSSWFTKFTGFDDSSYPGGKGKSVNGTFHVPTCDWYGDAKSGPPKCSGFYHDQEQTPEKAKPGGGSYPACKPTAPAPFAPCKPQ